MPMLSAEISVNSLKFLVLKLFVNNSEQGLDKKQNAVYN